MLQKLSIKNFVLIDELSIEFDEGLNILTGETGAGKSIIIGAISAVLGGKVSADRIRTGCDRSVIEATFDIASLPVVREMLDDAGLDADEDFLLIRREMYASGKGRCFI
ncbi:MAG: AAA family ATPase, partial [Spirochaetota bacterium]